MPKPHPFTPQGAYLTQRMAGESRAEITAAYRRKLRNDTMQTYLMIGLTCASIALCIAFAAHEVRAAATEAAQCPTAKP